MNIYKDRIISAMDIITRYGQTEGAHHKAWVLDQVAQRLLDETYNDWVKEMIGDFLPEEGMYEYEYEKGIAP